MTSDDATAFMRWLRVELLRLRSLDWGSGSRSISQLKDGVVKLSSFYRTKELTAKLGISEEALIEVIDSAPVISELEGKSFTLSWKPGRITLSWLEEGIEEWKMEFNQHISEEDGNYFSEFRWRTVIVYLDGTERVVDDTGPPKRVPCTEEYAKHQAEQMRLIKDKKERRDKSE